MSDTETVQGESESGETGDQSGSSGSSAFVESLQNGIRGGVLESLGSGEGGFESVGRELGEQVGRLFGELVGRKLDEQLQQITNEDDTAAERREADDEDRANNEEKSAGDDSADLEEMSDEALQARAEDLTEELEERGYE